MPSTIAYRSGSPLLMILPHMQSSYSMFAYDELGL
jgi:hypothetical protein